MLVIMMSSIVFLVGIRSDVWDCRVILHHERSPSTVYHPFADTEMHLNIAGFENLCRWLYSSCPNYGSSREGDH